MSVTPKSRRCRIVLRSFCSTALILWAAGIAVIALHVHMGIPSLIDAAAGTATVIAFITHVTQITHGGQDQLRRERDELIRDAETVLRLAAELVSQHAAVAAPAERPLQAVPRQVPA